MTKFVNGERTFCFRRPSSRADSISNANTIIIDRAGPLWSERSLQLRGGSGVTSTRLMPNLLFATPRESADRLRKRISAIRHIPRSAADSKIAMRDLEIRVRATCSARNKAATLPPVGFELYCQLLKESVAVLKRRKSQISDRSQHENWISGPVSSQQSVVRNCLTTNH